MRRVMYAAQLAGGHDFIRGLPEGYKHDNPRTRCLAFGRTAPVYCDRPGIGGRSAVLILDSARSYAGGNRSSIPRVSPSVRTA